VLYANISYFISDFCSLFNFVYVSLSHILSRDKMSYILTKFQPTPSIGNEVIVIFLKSKMAAVQHFFTCDVVLLD